MYNGSVIYFIKNTETGMLYVGQTLNYDKRIYTHEKDLLKGTHINKHLQHSFNFHGNNNFLFGILEFCKKEDLDIKESYYIDKLNTMHPHGFNLIDRKANRVSDSTRKILSEQAKKRFSVPSNHPWLGRHHTQESNEKNRKSNLNNIITEESKKKQIENTPRGEFQHSSKLKKHDIPVILSLIHEKSDIEIAKIYNVSPTCIWKIKTGKSWR